MRVLVTHAPRKMSIEEREMPEPGSGEVLIQIPTVGLCGSDIHLYAGTHPYRTYPAVFGHETSGRVTRIGEGVQGFKPGDHVVLEPLIWCGTCYPCSIGRTNCYEPMRTIGVNESGALADFFKVPARCLHKVSDDLDPRVASLCEPFSVGIHANYRGDI
jgi:L-gulonate 5-dehydrogenase